VAQICVEAIDLAFGSGTIGAAAFDDEATGPGLVKKDCVLAVLPEPSTSHSRTTVFMSS